MARKRVSPGALLSDPVYWRTIPVGGGTVEFVVPEAGRYAHSLRPDTVERTCDEDGVHYRYDTGRSTLALADQLDVARMLFRTGNAASLGAGLREALTMPGDRAASLAVLESLSELEF